MDFERAFRTLGPANLASFEHKRIFSGLRSVCTSLRECKSFIVWFQLGTCGRVATYRTRFLINFLQSLECAYPGTAGTRFALENRIRSFRTARRRDMGGSESRNIRRDVYICYNSFFSTWMTDLKPTCHSVGHAF